MIAGPRNHRQLTPDRSRGREFLLVRIAQRQHTSQITMQLGVNAVRRFGRWA